MWLCSISSAPNVSFECKCYFKNIDDPFDSLLIKTNLKYKYIYDETVFNIYGINENGEFGIGSMYVIPRNIEISEDWIVNFINKNLTSNFDRNSTE